MTKTEEIFRLSAPYSNPYQGSAPRILFVCSAGLLRSATAANYFAQKGWNTRSCGSESYALIPLSANLIHWAEAIYFMQESNRETALWRFRESYDLLALLKEKSVVVNIPDAYEYSNPELIKLLEERIILKEIKR